MHMPLSHSALVQAVLFAAGEPLSKKRLATLLDLTPEQLRDAALKLHQDLADSGLTLIEAGEELELRTVADAAPAIHKLRESELSRDLGKAGLETLAIVLYRNGATRSEVDWVRGVNSTAALRSLLLRGLVTRTEDESDRRRARYMPTIEALAHLGISHISELPNYEELTKELSQHEQPVVEVSEHEREG